MGVSKIDGLQCKFPSNGWFGGTPISGNLHIVVPPPCIGNFTLPSDWYTIYHHQLPVVFSGGVVNKPLLIFINQPMGIWHIYGCHYVPMIPSWKSLSHHIPFSKIILHSFSPAGSQYLNEGAWWLIPLGKWVITRVISGLTPLIPFITRAITHFLSGMNHQVPLLVFSAPRSPIFLSDWWSSPGGPVLVALLGILAASHAENTRCWWCPTVGVTKMDGLFSHEKNLLNTHPN